MDFVVVPVPFVTCVSPCVAVLCVLTFVVVFLPLCVVVIQLVAVVTIPCIAVPWMTIVPFYIAPSVTVAQCVPGPCGYSYFMCYNCSMHYSYA